MQSSDIKKTGEVNQVKSETLTIIINDAPYGVEKAWNALRLALTSLSASIKSNVNMFLLGDAVSIAKKGQHTPEGYYNLEKMLTNFIGKGGKARTCGTCLKARGLNQDDLVEGIEIGTMMGLTKWIGESRIALSF